MVEWHSILITWFVFVTVKLIARLRWRDAIGAAALSTVIQMTAPVFSTDSRLQIGLAVIVAAIWFGVLWLERRKPVSQQ